MVVYAVLCHWVMEVAREEVVPDRVGRASGHMMAFFYAYGGLLASMRTERIQREFNVLTKCCF